MFKICLFRRFAAIACSLVALFAIERVDAQNSHSKVLTKYITNDVVGVLYFDLDRLDLGATVQTATKLGFQEQDELADLIEAMPALNAEIGKLKQAGISRAYALLRASDVQSMGTSWVIPLKSGSDPATAKKVFLETIFMKLPQLFGEIEATNDAVLASATKDQMDRLKNDRPADANPRQAMWDALGDGALGIMMFADEDSRRVVSELMPGLPAPFESMTGEFVAEGLAWAGVELKLGKTPNLKIEVQANSVEAAKTLEEILMTSYGFLKQLPQTRQYIPETEFGYVFGALKPVRSGNRVSVSTDLLTDDMDRLAKMLAPQVKMARIAAANSKRLNTLRMFALGILNFESAHMRFPTQATVDENGKPLLSWRVQILPYLEQNDLYNQFHLDEPWDSEHNLKLVQRMPESFEDPKPESRNNNKEGKTIYLGAAGEGMIFNGGKEVGFGDLKDGSSNTILLATVAGDHAVPWTKPVDWQVNLNDPTAQLKETKRTDAEVVLADGSTHRIPIATDLKTWQNLIQTADGNIVEFPK